eukprot:2624135-Amphidinium_carterae.1
MSTRAPEQFQTNLPYPTKLAASRGLECAAIVSSFVLSVLQVKPDVGSLLEAVLGLRRRLWFKTKLVERTKPLCYALAETAATNCWVAREPLGTVCCWQTIKVSPRTRLGTDFVSFMKLIILCAATRDTMVLGMLLTARKDTSVTLEQLRCIRVVGRGGFGVVKMVQSRSAESLSRFPRRTNSPFPFILKLWFGYPRIVY